MAVKTCGRDESSVEKLHRRKKCAVFVKMQNLIVKFYLRCVHPYEVWALWNCVLILGSYLKDSTYYLMFLVTELKRDQSTQI